MVIPTVTILTSSTTYNTPVGCKYIKVYIIAQGGAGATGVAGSIDAQGCGGAAGQVLLRYFNAGSYTVTIAAAVTFDGVTATVGGAGGAGAICSGGSVGPAGSYNSGQQFDNCGFTSAEIDASGNGGAGMFSSGGRGCAGVSITNGGTGLGFGGGGGGGTGSTGTGGSGSAGAVIITEYY
jgi:hypothetical protein